MENLTKIQNELKVPKGNFNSFGKYKYRSCENILEAIKPILLKYNATLTLSDEILPVGNKVFIKSTAFLNSEKEAILVHGFAELSEHKGMSAEQATGTASSYARKYALNGLFLIDETEADPDSETVQPKSVYKFAEIGKINTVADLSKFWEINDSLHADKVFKEEVKRRKSELNGK